jgi:hypothetical protein
MAAPWATSRLAIAILPGSRSRPAFSTHVLACFAAILLID